MGDQWHRNIQLTQELVANVKRDLAERDRQLASGVSAVYTSSSISRNITKLAADIAELESRLTVMNADPQTHRVTQKELALRRGQVDALRSSKAELQQALKSGGAAQRGELMQDAPTRRGWGRNKVVEETDETRQLDSRQLLQSHDTMIEEQDAHLDTLSDSILRQKELGLAINAELDIHKVLLDDLSANVDRVGDRVHNATKATKKIEEDSSCCCCCIVM